MEQARWQTDFDKAHYEFYAQGNFQFFDVTKQQKEFWEKATIDTPDLARTYRDHQRNANRVLQFYPHVITVLKQRMASGENWYFNEARERRYEAALKELVVFSRQRIMELWCKDIARIKLIGLQEQQTAGFNSLANASKERWSIEGDLITHPREIPTDFGYGFGVLPVEPWTYGLLGIIYYLIVALPIFVFMIGITIRDKVLDPRNPLFGVGLSFGLSLFWIFALWIYFTKFGKRKIDQQKRRIEKFSPSQQFAMAVCFFFCSIEMSTDVLAQEDAVSPPIKRNVQDPNDLKLTPDDIRWIKSQRDAEPSTAAITSATLDLKAAFRQIGLSFSGSFLRIDATTGDRSFKNSKTLENDSQQLDISFARVFTALRRGAFSLFAAYDIPQQRLSVASIAVKGKLLNVPMGCTVGRRFFHVVDGTPLPFEEVLSNSPQSRFPFADGVYLDAQPSESLELRLAAFRLSIDTDERFVNRYQLGLGWSLGEWKLAAEAVVSDDLDKDWFTGAHVKTKIGAIAMRILGTMQRSAADLRYDMSLYMTGPIVEDWSWQSRSTWQTVESSARGSNRVQRHYQQVAGVIWRLYDDFGRLELKLEGQVDYWPEETVPTRVTARLSGGLIWSF